MNEKPDPNPPTDLPAAPAPIGRRSITETTAAPIPLRTGGRRHTVQHAARLYIYEGITCYAELHRRTGATVSAIKKARQVDQWDRFAAERLAAAAELDGSITPLRSVEAQSLIDEETARQRSEIPKLIKEASRTMEALQAAQPGSKTYAALIRAAADLRKLIEGATHYDTAKAEIQHRLRIAVAARTNEQLQGERRGNGAATGSDTGRTIDVSYLGEGE